MWNYRIIKDKDTYGLYEVIYNDDGEILAHSEEPEVFGESAEDLVHAGGTKFIDKEGCICNLR